MVMSFFVFSCLLFLFPLIIRFKQAIIALQEGRVMRGAQILFSLRCLLPPSRRSSRPRHRGGESRMHSRDPVRLREGSAWNPGTNSPSEKFFPAESLVSSCSSGPLGRRIHQPYVAPNIIPYSVFLIFWNLSLVSFKRKGYSAQDDTWASGLKLLLQDRASGYEGQIQSVFRKAVKW